VVEKEQESAAFLLGRLKVDEAKEACRAEGERKHAGKTRKDGEEGGHAAERPSSATRLTGR